MEKRRKSKGAVPFLSDILKKENRPLLFLIIFAVYAVVCILVGTLALHIPIVPVCVIIILEALLAALLNKIPLWIHGLVFIAQIVCGIISGKLVFMILMAFVYTIAIAFLFIWAHHD